MPSEPTMRFFTRDLFCRFNSPDAEVADQADAEWETAIRRYREHLDLMPDLVRGPSRQDLHDAELLGTDQPDAANLAIFSLQQDDQILALIYTLWDQMRRSPSPPDWPFARERVHWLYDEWDHAPGQTGDLLHRILWSDGAITEIPCWNAIRHTIPFQIIHLERVRRIA